MGQLAAADGVQLVFHLGGELVVDQIGQVGLEQLGDGESDPSGHEHVASLEDVFSLLDRVDDRGVGAGPADALFFQLPR